ncbi:GIY-YIG nuclease family protein [Tardiphaga sp.]|uniref:GIY-YIG nuclease family protein n=1 Tax=Tardiphaga sp. TaxID=1926292 RepID=UPI002605C600|nr:GIY-YIG nuclease family protein [Tardiphaga sp.]
MAGLVPAIHDLHNRGMRRRYVYFLTNRPNGILYVGVTSDLVRRIYEHRTSAADGFTKRYGLKRLVYYEIYDDIRTAIQREHNIKHWSRTWKVRLILASNPNWDDLWESII